MYKDWKDALVDMVLTGLCCGLETPQEWYNNIICHNVWVYADYTNNLDKLFEAIKEIYKMIMMNPVPTDEEVVEWVTKEVSLKF